MTMAATGLGGDMSNCSIAEVDCEPFIQEISVAYTFMVAVIFLDSVTILGNSLVIMAFVQDKRVRVARNMYILNLALDDLIIALFSVPFYASTIILGSWELGQAFCGVWMSVDLVLRLEGVFSIILITHDRYRAVEKPFTYHSKHNSKKTVLVENAGSWMLSLVLRIPFILTSFVWATQKYARQSEGMCFCSPMSSVDPPFRVGLAVYDVTYTAISVTCEYFIPLTCIVFWNCSLFFKIRQQSRKVLDGIITRNHRLLAARDQAADTPNKNKDSRAPADNAMPATPPVKPANKITLQSTIADAVLTTSRVSACLIQQNEEDGKTGVIHARNPRLRRRRYCLHDQVLSSISHHASEKYFSGNEAEDISVSSFSCASKGRKLSMEYQTEELREATEVASNTQVDSPSTRPDDAFILPLVDQIPPSARVARPDEISHKQFVWTTPVEVINSPPFHSFGTPSTRKTTGRASLILLFITLELIIFRTPYVTARIAILACDGCVSRIAYKSLFWLSWGVSIINPFLYAFISPAYRLFCFRVFHRIRDRFLYNCSYWRNA